MTTDRPDPPGGFGGASAPSQAVPSRTDARRMSDAELSAALDRAADRYGAALADQISATIRVRRLDGWSDARIRAVILDAIPQDAHAVGIVRGDELTRYIAACVALAARIMAHPDLASDRRDRRELHDVLVHRGIVATEAHADA